MEISYSTEKLSSLYNNNHTRGFTVKPLFWEGKKSQTKPKHKTCPRTPEYTLTKTEQC